MSKLIICLIFGGISIGCTKKSCFDPKLKEEYKSALCTADCPGVVGCDGKTYCNECNANAQGIRVE